MLSANSTGLHDGRDRRGERWGRSEVGQLEVKQPGVGTMLCQTCTPLDMI